MFTVIAFGLIALVGWKAHRESKGDFAQYLHREDSPELRILVHLRQDSRLAAYLLAAVVVMLGIVADRIH